MTLSSAWAGIPNEATTNARASAASQLRAYARGGGVPWSPGYLEAKEQFIDSGKLGKIGVVEVYRVPVALFQTIAQGLRLIWAIALGGGLFLYLLPPPRTESGEINSSTW